MDRIINEITLDFTQNISLASVNIKQGDDGGRLIRVYLKNNGVSVPVSTANGDTATLYASVNGMITADGTAVIINDTTNTVDILITSTLSAAAGREHCEIRITSGTGKIHTARFTILVGAASASADMPEVIKTADIIGRVGDAESDIDALDDRVTALEEGGSGGGGGSGEGTEELRDAVWHLQRFLIPAFIERILDVLLAGYTKVVKTAEARYNDGDQATYLYGMTASQLGKTFNPDEDLCFAFYQGVQNTRFSDEPYDAYSDKSMWAVCEKREYSDLFNATNFAYAVQEGNEHTAAHPEFANGVVFRLYNPDRLPYRADIRNVRMICYAKNVR